MVKMNTLRVRPAKVDHTTVLPRGCLMVGVLADMLNLWVVPLNGVQNPPFHTTLVT